ncbi:MAG: hypothetical protein RR217_01205 [Mucinivorans sp.]
MKTKLLMTMFFGAMVVACSHTPSATNESTAPKDNEKLVYKNAAAPLSLKVGEKHPTQNGWKFYTAHEFNDRDTDAFGGPLGFEAQNKWFHKYASINNHKAAKVKNGTVTLKTFIEADSIVNSFGNKVIYTTYSVQTTSVGSKDHWCDFRTGMRYEVRMRCSSELGFNHALWFMPEVSRLSNKGGAEYQGWPKCGEIDLMETPRNKPNQTTWFTLHSENWRAGGQKDGAGPSTYKTAKLASMENWNIYWIELYKDHIVGGVNGDAFFKHTYGDNGNTDWPWDKSGWYFIMTPGLSITPDSWMGAIEPEKWDPKHPPMMEVDWIRVYTNDEYKGVEPPKVKFY